MDELTLLQAVRLKGRVSDSDLAATTGVNNADIASAVAPLHEAGLLAAGKTIKITPEGRARLAQLLADERSAIDTDALAAAYEDFRSVNGDFKALVSDWQLRNGEPNTHDDPEYDGNVLSGLDGIHQRVLPILAAVAAEIPRLESYSAKLASALAKVKAGETTWLTRPIIDSYHTVWFEVHEELILAAGLTRDAEAKAGHAQ
ncbi:MAG: MarR family transcriptional regulator [Mycobacterium sp.]